MEAQWDDDIAEMHLSDEEKNGLQLYRNYNRTFRQHARAEFVKACDEAQYDLEPLRQILRHVSDVEPRTLPVIACAFADDHLEAMFRREIPEGVPGGKGDLLGSMGSLGRLAQRIQIAYAFGWMSSDLLIELNLLRKMRNDISHRWDLSFLEARLDELVTSKQFAIEQELLSGALLQASALDAMSNVQKLRVRTLWLLGRVFYETTLWPAALKEGHNPNLTLYSVKPTPTLLSQVSGLCSQATIELVREWTHV